MKQIALAAIAAWTCAVGGAMAQNAKAPGDACEIGAATPSAVIASCTVIINDASASVSERARALSVRGAAHARADELDQALEDFNAALEANPTFAGAFRDRGILRSMQGDLAAGLPDLDRAVELDPTDSLSFGTRASLYHELGNYDQAIRDFDTAITLAPEVSEYRNGRCWAGMAQRRDLARALSDCNAAIDLDPRNANALNSRGAVKFLLGDYRGAIADYSASIALRPSMAGSWYGRGAARFRLGEEAVGRADMEAGVAREPGVAQRYGRFGITPDREI